MTKIRLHNLMFFLLASTTLAAQNLSVINAVDIQPKVNGLLVRFSVSTPIPTENITAWQAQNHWFYITFFQCQSDSFALVNSYKPIPEMDRIDILNSKESTQIAFRILKSVEDFDFQSNNNGYLDLALRFPREEVLAALESEVISQNEVLTLAPAKPKKNSPLYLRLRPAAYLVGVSLSVSGILANDNRSGTSWELPTGVAILGLTYIYDHYIHPRVHHE